MTEKTDLLNRLQASSVLDGIRWAYGSAVSRTLTDYSEEAGHDAAWFGSTRFILFRDRLDRVYSCGKYELRTGDDASTGLDLVHAELTEKDIETMPKLAPEVVRRSNLHGSPGWLFTDVRFLLASAKFGKIDSLPWPQKSETKQTVANQPNPEPLPTLFDDMPSDELAGLSALPDESLDIDTFVVAHSLDSVSQKRELVFGRPRLNNGGGDAWYWYENLLGGPTLPGGQLDVPTPVRQDDVPDAPVRLRRSGEQPAVGEGAQ